VTMSQDENGSSKSSHILNIPNIAVNNSAAGASAGLNTSGESLMTDEESEVGNGYGNSSTNGTPSKEGKLTLTALLEEGLVEPGVGVMSIDYLGQTFKGDLLSCGKIKSQETGLIFNNPSAWAISCKKIINPAKKSGCGWASVKYKGRKMDHFKAIWSKNKANRRSSSTGTSSGGATTNSHKSPRHSLNGRAGAVNEMIENNERALEPDHPMAAKVFQPAVIRHSQLTAKHPMDDKDVLVEVEAFEDLGKIQPFHVSIASSALLLVDLHSHLSPEPVCGYLAGHWDLNAHNLAITHTYPCLSDTRDPAEAQACETEIYNAIYTKHLSVVGWYKTTPGYHKALPSIRDAEAQLDNQIKLLGSSDATYSPCIGLIVSPYTSGTPESEILSYWVCPPPENVYPQEYGKPLRMTHSVVQDPCLSTEMLSQIEGTILYYSNQQERVPYTSRYNRETLYITKLGRTLIPKFPRDQDEKLWQYMRVLILGEEGDRAHPDPLVAKLTANKIVNGNAATGRSSKHSRYNNPRRKSSYEEEEIDDDEENALKVTSIFSNGHNSRPRKASTASNSSSVSLVPINHHLQQQQSAAVAPSASNPSLVAAAAAAAAYDNPSITITSTTVQKSRESPQVNNGVHDDEMGEGDDEEEEEEEEETEAPLDFSTSSATAPQVNDVNGQEQTAPLELTTTPSQQQQVHQPLVAQPPINQVGQVVDESSDDENRLMIQE